MTHKDAYKWCNILAVACLVIALLAFAFTGAMQMVVGVLAVLVACASVVVMLKYWRCPHCGSLLPRSFAVPRYCPHCGKEM